MKARRCIHSAGEKDRVGRIGIDGWRFPGGNENGRLCGGDTLFGGLRRLPASDSSELERGKGHRQGNHCRPSKATENSRLTSARLQMMLFFPRFSGGRRQRCPNELKSGPSLCVF